MTIKECAYCQSQFEATRSDAKYCSKSCKQEAYLLRKTTNIGNTNENRPIDAKRRINAKDVNPSITLSRSEFQRILNTGTNKAPLDHLLNEKDFGREVVSQNSELKIELKYMSKDLEQMQSRLTTLEQENKELTKKVEEQEESVFKTFIGTLMQSEQLFPMIGAILANRTNSSHIGNAYPSGNSQNMSNTNQNNQENEELTEAEELESKYLNHLEEIYPDIPPHQVLAKLVELIEGNKAMADSILKN